MNRTIIYAFFLSGFALIHGLSYAASDEFFKGKSVRFVVGNSVGGAMDDWGRFLAQHLGRNIPGNPDFVVQNMPGAGGVIAANYVYNVAKSDGLTLGFINPAIYIDQLLGSKEVKFDWRNFSWLGSPERIDQVLFIRSDVPYKSLEDMRKATEPPRCAALARAGLGYFLPKLLEEGLGVKLHMVLGYGGGGEMNLRSRKEKCTAGPAPFRPTSVVNLPAPGSRRVSCAHWSRAEPSDIRSCPRFQRYMSSWKHIKRRMLSSGLPKCCFPRAISGGLLSVLRGRPLTGSKCCEKPLPGL